MKRLILVAQFILLAMTGVLAKTDQAEFGAVDRIIVIGDAHGDFGQLIAALKTADLIDSKLRWTGGATHLVQLGDLPDRGPDTLKIIEFLRRLEKRAARAKGRAHILIGNHEAMNMHGDLRYVVKEEFEAFSTRRSEKLLEDLFQAEIAWIKKNIPEEE